jgi:hypothetical protein
MLLKLLFEILIQNIHIVAKQLKRLGSSVQTLRYSLPMPGA